MKRIPLSGKKGAGLFALVDDADYERVAEAGPWHLATHAGGYQYARNCRREDGRMVWTLMHRLVMNAPDETLVDHKDGNGLRNTRDNLRTCSRKHNKANSLSHRGSLSRYKGVTLDRGRWRAKIKANERSLHLGMFDSEEDAARAYDAAAREHFGKFGRYNFPRDGERSALATTGAA